MSNNTDILARESHSLAGANRIKYFDIVIDHGRGALLYDVDGKEYIDLLASASAANIGYCHPRVVKAIQAQAEQLIHFTPVYFANKTTAALPERLAALAPGDFPKKVAFGNSGSDSNDALIKFARGYTGRPYIITFTGAYHGSTYGALSLSGVSLNMTRKIGPLLPNIIKMPFPDIHMMLPGESEHDFAERFWRLFEDPFLNWLPVEEVAAVLIEPIQGDGGIVAAPKEYIQRLYDFTRKHGILFTVDEINQGFGRTGKMWAVDHFGVAPDLITVGKSIASGMPLSALIGRKEVMESLASPAHVFTTAGNPICAAASLATLDVIRDEHLVERSAKLGAYAHEFFRTMQTRYNFVGDIRLYGLNGGIDIVDRNGKPDAEATVKIMYRLCELGVIMISLRSNILRFQPPLVITDDQLKEAFSRIERVFDELASGKLQMPKLAGNVGW